MTHVFRTFIKILRDPQVYRQQQQAEFEAARQKILWVGRQTWIKIRIDYTTSNAISSRQMGTG